LFRISRPNADSLRGEVSLEKSKFFRGIDQFLMRLSGREKWMLGGGGTVSVLLLTYFLLIDPVLIRMDQLDGLIPRKQQALQELLSLKSDYLEIEQTIGHIEKRIPLESTFSALAFLEENATKNRIRDKIAFIRPLSPQIKKPYREIPVEVKIENVELSQIIPFLTGIESAPQGLKIKRLSMKTRFSDPDMMDVTFLVLSYEKLSS
jgi:type II secretory pathway component PulM